jgi:hypothetical protein
MIFFFFFKFISFLNSKREKKKLNLIKNYLRKKTTKLDSLFKTFKVRKKNDNFKECME